MRAEVVVRRRGRGLGRAGEGYVPSLLASVLHR